MLRSIALVVTVAAAVGLGPARAQEKAEPPPPRGHLTAFACEALSGPLSVQVQLMDNAETNLRLKELFVQRLQKNGVQISDSAPLVISLEVDVARQAARRKEGDLLDVRVGGDDPEINMNDYARVRMNVWSTSRDSLLTGRQDRVEEQGFDQLRLRASLNSKQDGRCLWQGELVHDLDGDDAARVGSRMVPLLADSIGKPANRQPIRDE